MLSVSVSRRAANVEISPALAKQSESSEGTLPAALPGVLVI